MLIFLADCPKGVLPEAAQRKLEVLLSRCWDDLAGSSAERMEGYKLHEAKRHTEQMVWDPPFLRFQIDRHGGTVLGSSRGGIHSWEVNLDAQTAAIVGRGARQLRPRAAPLDVQALAATIAARVTAGQADSRIVRRGNTVRILTSQIASGDNEQTTDGRRRRFRRALEQLLQAQGWRRKNAGSHLVFERSSAK